MAIKHKVCYLIIITFCARLFVASLLELGNDEVYYYTYALHLQWNYFDHPPAVALLIRLSTLNLWLKNEVFVRLGSIFFASAATWLCYKIGAFIQNERTGFYAAILYNTSIYTSIISGIFILPDSPQVVCWLAALFVLLKVVSASEEKRNVPVSYWLLFGLLSGACIQCKVHGIFLWLGLGLYVLIYNRKMLVQPGLYFSFIFTVIIISPIIIWNINNHFATWIYHSNRVEVHQLNFNINNFLPAFFGQIVYNNPVNVFIAFKAVSKLKNISHLQSPIQKILLLMGLPVIISVTVISLFNSVLPHWSGPGFLTLSFIGASYLDRITKITTLDLPVIIKRSAFLIITVIIVGISVIRYYPGTIGSKEKENYGSNDFTLDLSGWRSFERQYTIWINHQNVRKYKQLKIVCNKWFPAAHIEYYVAGPANTAVVGVGSINDLHHFAWLNQARTDLKKGDDALTIVPSNYSINAIEDYKRFFSSVTRLQKFSSKRNGKVCRYFEVYLLKNYQLNDEAHLVKLN